MTTRIKDKYWIARQSRGKVPEFHDDYVERFIPPEVLRKIEEFDGQTDSDGYVWGPDYIFATRLRDAPVVVIAQKPLGMGCCEALAIDAVGTRLHLFIGEDGFPSSWTKDHSWIAGRQPSHGTHFANKRSSAP